MPGAPDGADACTTGCLLSNKPRIIITEANKPAELDNSDIKSVALAVFANLSIGTPSLDVAANGDF